MLTSAGLNSVLEKYYNAEYGRCPRVHCKDQPVLPAAVSDVPHEEAVKVRLCLSASASFSRNQYRIDYKIKEVKSSASAEKASMASII